MYKDKIVNSRNGPIDVTNNQTTVNFQGNEIGLKHPNNKATIRINDNGVINIFSTKTVGIKLDRNAKSINMFGNKINLFGPRIEFFTRANGLIWNGWKFNSRMYEQCNTAPITNEDISPRNFKLVGTQQIWTNQGWEDQQVLIVPYIKDTANETYSDDIKEIAKELGFKIGGSS